LQEGWTPIKEFGIKKSEFDKIKNPARVRSYGRIVRDLRVEPWDPIALRAGWFLPPPAKVIKVASKVEAGKLSSPRKKSPGAKKEVLSSPKPIGEKKNTVTLAKAGGSKLKKQGKRGYSRRSSGRKAGGRRSAMPGTNSVFQSPFIQQRRFLRGDVNQDGLVSMLDANVLLKFIYNKEEEPSCLESADVNNDGKILPGDAFQLIRYLSDGILPPAAPFPAFGRDPDKPGSGKDTGCISYEAAPEEEEVEEGGAE